METKNKLIPAPIDEKNVTTDWIEEIFDNCDAVKGNGIKGSGKMMTGFVGGSACCCWYVRNLIFWQILQDYANDAKHSYELLLKRLKEHDTPPLVVEYDTSLKLRILQKFYHTL